MCVSSIGKAAFCVIWRVQRSSLTKYCEKPYTCTQCDYSCSRSENLKTHMRVHTGEKPYSCTQCDYSCALSQHLKRHMRVHTGEKPYSCTHCDYFCSQSSTLNNHMKVHTGEKHRCIKPWFLVLSREIGWFISNCSFLWHKPLPAIVLRYGSVSSRLQEKVQQQN